jgi:hypothetical protein
MDLGTHEYYDGESNQFVYEEYGVVRFEYTLKVVYDWEFKWRKPFLKGEYTDEELLDFYKMMALDPIKEEAFTEEVMERLSEYIGDSSTATIFSSHGDGQNNNQMLRQKNYTAEEIYALMVSAGIPLEFENRNLNRLLVILRIISTQNSPPKKMTRDEILKQNREINRQRREQYKTKG